MIYMNGNIFLDTNILVYAYDRSEPLKQGKTIRLIDALSSIGAGAISTQVLSELFVALTGKIRIPLSQKDGIERVEHHMQIWKIFNVTSMIILEALRGVRVHHFSFWDSLVWATAKLNQISIVFSEDFSDGSTVDGVQFVNPYTAKFEVSDWV